MESERRRQIRWMIFGAVLYFVLVLTVIAQCSVIYKLYASRAEASRQFSATIDEYGRKIVKLDKQIEELVWYKKTAKRIHGENFGPGNFYSTTITLSSYNPLEAQCDSTPLIASDNGLVAPGIIALPQHYRLFLGLPLQQIVWIPPYGQFVIRDHMNNRKPRGRGDIISFIPDWSEKFGKVKDLTMYWIPGNVHKS